MVFVSPYRHKLFRQKMSFFIDNRDNNDNGKNGRNARCHEVTYNPDNKTTVATEKLLFLLSVLSSKNLKRHSFYYQEFRNSRLSLVPQFLTWRKYTKKFSFICAIWWDTSLCDCQRDEKCRIIIIILNFRK